MTLSFIAMRTIIDLPEDQLDRLASVCQREGISRAEAVRRAVAVYLARQPTDADLEGAFGMWAHRLGGSRAYVDRARSEWGSSGPGKQRS